MKNVKFFSASLTRRCPESLGGRRVIEISAQVQSQTQIEGAENAATGASAEKSGLKARGKKDALGGFAAILDGLRVKAKKPESCAGTVSSKEIQADAAGKKRKNALPGADGGLTGTEILLAEGAETRLFPGNVAEEAALVQCEPVETLSENAPAGDDLFFNVWDVLGPLETIGAAAAETGIDAAVPIDWDAKEPGFHVLGGEETPDSLLPGASTGEAAPAAELSMKSTEPSPVDLYETGRMLNLAQEAETAAEPELGIEEKPGLREKAAEGRRRGRVEAVDFNTFAKTNGETGAVTGNAVGDVFDLDIPVELRVDSAAGGGRGQSWNYASNGGGGGRGFEDALAAQLRGDLGGDLVRQASILLRENGEGTIKLSLKPETLGNVKIRLEMTENKITGQIVVESSEALRAFERELPVLEKEFQESGLGETSLQMSLSGDNGGGDFSRYLPQTAALFYEAGGSGVVEVDTGAEAGAEALVAVSMGLVTGSDGRVSVNLLA